MTGGLIQLISSGNEDLILTYKPELTFFKKIYHRHTNFSKFSNKVLFNEPIKFGKKSNIIIPKNGDLLDNIYIKIELPKLKCNYKRNKYSEYKKRFEDYKLRDIDYDDYIITSNNIKNLNSFFKLNQKYYLSITDNDYFDGVSISILNNKRILNTNNWPTFDNWENYSSVNINKPSKKVFKLRLPITPIYAPSGSYSYFSGEFNESSFVSYDDSLDSVAAQMWVIGIVGRFTTPNIHWSDTNTPLEAVLLDPLPAATGGKSDDPLDYLTLTQANQSWDDNFINYVNNNFVSNQINGTYYKPGYFYRYFLGTTSSVLNELELDSYGGHVQPDGDWHMHVGTLFDTGYENCVIGYALDGTPIIGTGSTVLDSSGNSIGIATSSWISRTDYSHPSAKDGSGYYHYDYVYSTGTGNLDEFNGGYINLSDGTTTSLTYAYFMTTTYPIWPRNLRGKIDSETYQEFTNVILQKDEYFNYNMLNKNLITYYISAANLNEKSLDMNIDKNDSIFSNFKYEDNIIYNSNILNPTNLSEDMNLFHIYANYLYCHNYHSYFVYFLHKIINSSDEVVLTTPYTSLGKLFEFYKSQLVTTVNVESMIMFDLSNSFVKGTDIIGTLDVINLLSKHIYSLSYILKISKQDFIDNNNLKTIFLSATEDIYKSIYNVYKKIAVKSTNANDEEFNNNFYYNIIESKFIENLKYITNVPSKSGLEKTQYTILETSQNELTNKISISLDNNLVEFEIGQVIFGFLESNVDQIYPDTYYKITFIDFDNLKLICEITVNSLISPDLLDSYIFSDGINIINVCDMIPINSDIITNYRFIDNSSSNYLNSLSNFDYMDFVRDANENLLENNFHLIINFINSLMTNGMTLSTCYNINQTTKIVDGSSVKNIIDQDSLDVFIKNFRTNIQGNTYELNDALKYILLDRLNLITDDFINSQLLNWDTFITSSLDSDFNNLLKKIGQIEYLKNNRPSIGIIYSRINLSDGATSSAIGDIYQIYSNDGNDQPDTDNGVLAEVTVISKTTITSPSSQTTLVCTINEDYTYVDILEGYILVKSTDAGDLNAKITTVYDSYNDVNNITTENTITRGYLYTNIYYNYYLMKISNEILKSIPSIKVELTGLYLENYQTKTDTDIIPAVGDIYYLYDLYESSVTAKFEVIEYSYDDSVTILSLKIDSDSSMNFKLKDDFWIIDNQNIADSNGKKIKIVDKSKLLKINSVTTNIMTRIYGICSQDSYNTAFEIFSKEVAITYFANYTQFFNSNSIANVFIDLIQDNIDLTDLKLFLEGKTVSDVTYNFTDEDTFTKNDLINITKSYLKVEYMETDSGFSIIKGMNYNTDKYFYFIDQFFKNPEEIGYEFYTYINSENTFRSDIIKNKIESIILKSSEVHSYSESDTSTYIDYANNIKLSMITHKENYYNNKNLLLISNFDIESNVFEDPDITRSKIEQYYSDNNLIVDTVNSELYNSGLNFVFSNLFNENTLYNIMSEINDEYKKYMLIENILTALLKNTHYIRDLTFIKNLNKFIESTDLDTANEFLLENNLDKYKHFSENSSNIYVPDSDYDYILEKFNFINSLSNESKLIEQNIHKLDYFVSCLIIDYYNSANATIKVSDLEKYISENLVNSQFTDTNLDLKFKYGIVMTEEEYNEINYQNLTVYVNDVDQYGSITSLYIVQNKRVILDNLVFPFDIRKIWFANKETFVRINLSDSGNILNLFSNSVPPNKMPDDNPRDFKRNISIRVGTNPDNSDDDNIVNKIWYNKVYDVGVLYNGIILGSTFYDKNTSLFRNNKIPTAPEGYNWNLVNIYNNLGADDYGGFKDASNNYKIFSSKFLTKYKSLGIDLPYYKSSNYEGDIFRHSNGHSKIVGISLDGYPIYGPFGYDGQIIGRIRSSYRLKTTVTTERSELEYELGSFIEDFEFVDGLGHLDKYNGRYISTPEYPYGTYAYYMTIDENNNPEFPYVIGDYFKSTPSLTKDYMPVDDTDNINTNILPSSASSEQQIKGFDNNEELFLAGGSGKNGEVKIYHNESFVSLEIIKNGFKYKKGDLLKLKRKSLPETIEFYDEKKILLKRKSRFKNLYFYNYYDDKLYLTPIYEKDVRNLRSFLMQLKYMILYDQININMIKVLINSRYLRMLPTNMIIEQLMTLDKNIDKIPEEILNVDFTGKIRTLTKKSFFKDLFSLYIEKYDNGNFTYFYDDFTNYMKYDRSEYDLLKLDLVDLLSNVNIDTTDIHLINQITFKFDDRLMKLHNNNKNLESNMSILEGILERPETPKFSWVGDIGNYIFKNIDLYFNDLLIDKQDSEWVNLWKNLNVNSNKLKGYNRLIGNLEDLYILDINEKPSKTLYIPMNFWFCNKSGFNIPIIAMPYVEVKLSVLLEDINLLVRKDYGVEIEGSMDIKSSLLVNYIYLDDTERKLFAESRHEYLIEQVQYNSSKMLYKNLSDINLELSFKNNIKDIFYVLKKNKNIFIRDRNNFSLLDNTVNGGNPIFNTSLEFNGRQRLNDYSGEYTNYITPYEKYSSTPSDGINVISFSLENNESQPTGSCNFSMIEKPYLKVNFNKSFFNDSDGEIHVYARSYNILRIMSGLAGLAFVE